MTLVFSSYEYMAIHAELQVGRRMTYSVESIHRGIQNVSVLATSTITKRVIQYAVRFMLLFSHVNDVN